MRGREGEGGVVPSGRHVGERRLQRHRLAGGPGAGVRTERHLHGALGVRQHEVRGAAVVGRGPTLVADRERQGALGDRTLRHDEPVPEALGGRVEVLLAPRLQDVLQVVPVEVAEVVPLHLRRGGLPLGTRRVHVAGLAADGHPVALLGEVVLVEGQRVGEVGAPVVGRGEEAVVVVTDPRDGAAVERLRLGDRPLGAARYPEDVLLHAHRPQLDGPVGRNRFEQCVDDGTPLRPVLGREHARVRRIGREVVGVVALSPEPDEAGLDHGDDVGVVLEDRRQLLDVAEHDVERRVTVGRRVGPVSTGEVGEARDDRDARLAGGVEVRLDEREPGRVEGRLGHEPLEVEHADELGDALLAVGGERRDVERRVPRAALRPLRVVVRVVRVVEAALRVRDDRVTRLVDDGVGGCRGWCLRRGTQRGGHDEPAGGEDGEETETTVHRNSNGIRWCTEEVAHILQNRIPSCKGMLGTGSK